MQTGDKSMAIKSESRTDATTKILSQLRNFVQANGMIFALLLMMAIGAFLSPYFLTPHNLLNLLIQNCNVAIAALGISYVLISGGIDLSIGAVMGMVAIFICGLTQYNGFQEWEAIILSFILALAVGAMNGWLISRFKIESVVVTLGSWYIVQGLTQNYILSRVTTAPSITAFLGSGSIVGIPTIIIITLIVVIVTHLVLTKTVLGRWAFAMGGNLAAARNSGVPIHKARIIFFALCSFYAFISSILLTGRIFAVDASAGSGFIFLAPAAAVVGGTSLFGGKGNALHAVIGALIMGVIANALDLTRVSFFWQQVAVGVAILLAVSIDALRRTRH
jgi:ribose transport system permease protein